LRAAQVGRTLRELDLSHNAISTITGPWDCPVLEKLNLSYNTIVAIDAQAFSRLGRLRQLLLSHNAIGDSEARAFRQLLAKCTVLEELDLSHNQLWWARRALVGEGPARSLKKLSLANNRLMAMEVLMCEGLERLEELDLSHNGLEKIEEKALLGVESSLQRLDLSFNVINELPVGVLFLPPLLFGQMTRH
jgi:Leucine-rich repeat (LRR) protein